jgi:transposase-like protein
VRLGERQSYKDWLDLGRDLACWGLQEPWLVVSDGAPGLLEASEPEHAERRLRALVGELQREYPSAAACLADDLPARCVNPRYPPQLRKRLRSTNLLERSLEEVQRRVTVIGRLPGEPAA